ncbi:MAG: hypothetical protein KKB50_14365 [Planctomycetes bacterium]|nr:hypothetical protein [Planctomycetota bacterium]
MTTPPADFVTHPLGSAPRLSRCEAKEAERVERLRLRLILTLAFLLLCDEGLRSRQHYRPSMCCSSNGPKQCSIFTIGRVMFDRLNLSPASAFAAIAGITAAAPNWG